MAVLSAAARAALCAEFQRDASRDRDVFGALTKAELAAAVDALDDYFSANQAAIRQAVPLPARTVLTAAQLVRLVKYVITKRHLTGA